MGEEEKSDELMMAEALEVARVAFQKYFSQQGIDPSYFDYRFTAWVVDSNFENRLARVEIEREVKK